MIDIVPNWHPIVVHFPIALIVTSTVLFYVGILLRATKYSKEMLITSKWSLWGAGLTAIIAATFGWIAYNSVAHDATSHAAMTIHRNWAIPTAIYILLLAVYSYFNRENWGREKVALAAGLLFIASILTSVVGWLGAEAVYRHGIGVMRIPSTAADTHMPLGHESTESEHHH